MIEPLNVMKVSARIWLWSSVFTTALGCGNSSSPDESRAMADASVENDALADLDAGGATDGQSHSGTVWLAFAADFATGTTCGDEPTGSLGAAGCDIYRAKLDPSSYAPLTVERLTTDAVPEVFPSITRDGSRVYFHTLDSKSARSIGFVDAATKARSIVIAGAQYADVFPDGSKLAYSDVTAGYVVSYAALDSAGTKAGASTPLTTFKPSQDPNVGNDGQRVLFHVTGSSPGVYLSDLSGSAPLTVSNTSGFGHCALSPSQTKIVCDSATGTGLSSWTISGTNVSGPAVAVADPSNLGALDSDYASCMFTSVDFPSFCDDSHLTLSISCVGPSGILFSKVYLADLATSPATLSPLGATLATAFGGPGKTSWTPHCRVSP